MVSKKRFSGYVGLVSFHKGILVENYTNLKWLLFAWISFKVTINWFKHTFSDYYTVKICFQSKLCKIHRFVKSDMPTYHHNTYFKLDCFGILIKDMKIHYYVLTLNKLQSK